MNRSLYLVGRLSRFGRAGLYLLVLCTAGCGRVQTISGAVTLDGEPLSGVSVVFRHVERNETMGGIKVDEEGRFLIPDNTERIRWVPGEHRVRVIDPDAVKMIAGGGTPRLRFPVRYMKKDSPLTVFLESGSNSELKIALTSE